MSNNIYDILKKMQNLEAPKQSLTESKKVKPDYIDIDKDGDKTEPMKKAAQEKSKGAVAEAVATVEAQLNEKYMGFKKTVAAIKKGGSAENPEAVAAAIGRKKYGKEKFQKAAAAGKKLGEDALDFLRSPEGIAKRKAAKDKYEQDFADRSAKHFSGQVGDQYHDQLMKTNPAYRDEFLDRVGKIPMNLDTYRKDSKDLQAKLQAKLDPMGGPTNIDYEKIKKNPMATRAGEQGTDWRPWGPGPKEYFDTDEFGRPVREGEMDESGLQAYLGKKKYGEEGMRALQQAGREGASKEKMARIRAQHDKMDEGNYNEDMLSPSQKKFAALAEPENKITYADKIAGAKKGVKKEGPEILKIKSDQAKAQGKDEFKVGDKTFPVKEDNTLGPFGSVDYSNLDDKGHPRLNPAQAKMVWDHPKYDPNLSANAQWDKHFDNKGYQRLSHDQAMQISKHPNYNPNLSANAQGNLLNKNEGRTSMPEGEAYDAAWAKTQSERKAWEKSNPDKKYYDQGPAERHDMELRKARAADDAAKDAKRSPLGRVANTLSRGLFGQDIDEGRTSMREGWEEMQKYLEKKRGPESKGGAGKKAGTRYGGSAQKDDDEETDGEGKPVEKKKGRPKGTGGGAKFNFKKPKD